MTDPIVEAARAILPRYEVGEVLGRGGWGVVLAGSHRDLQRDVAIKVLSPELTVDAAVRRRFVSEARLLATFDHPHVVRIHDYVEEHETCALVMERLSGGSLRDLVRLAAPSPQRITAIVVAALHGLEHAHQRSVLHRDVKPDNIMLSGSGVPKVTDFGIGIVLGASAERLTAEGMALGTPAYMPPEQIAGTAELGPTADVWSTAAMLYHLLSGVPPYPISSSVQASLLARLNESPPMLTDVAEALPGAIGEVVMRALELDPADRFPTALAFADALEQAGTEPWGAGWIGRSGVDLHRTAPVAQPAGATAGFATLPPGDADRPTSGGSATATPGPATNGATRRRRRLLPVAAAAAVALIAGATYGGIRVLGDDDPGGGRSGGPAAGPSTTDGGSAPPPAASAVPPPAGWPTDLPVTVDLDRAFDDRVADVVPKGTFVNRTLYGEPRNQYAWNADGHGATEVVQSLLDQGMRPWLTYWVLRTLGRTNGSEVGDADELQETIKDPTLMERYWTDVRAVLTQLGKFDLVIPLDVDPDVPGYLESANNDEGRPPDQVQAAVGSTGVDGLDGVPDTATGWAEAWARLRDELAPNVRLGLPIAQWGVGDYLVPARPNNASLAAWTRQFGAFAQTLGGGFDYLDVNARNGSPVPADRDEPGVDHTWHRADYQRLLRYVRALVKGSGLPAVLDDLPFGNTVSPVMDDTDFHYTDNAVEYFLGDDRSHLDVFRTAGVVGLAFSVAEETSQGSCPCDADGDGAPDDGGYFAERLHAYDADPETLSP